MRSVLFAWELGDGLGHVSRLIRIAERLREAGVRCRFAVRQLELAGRAVRSAGFDVLQAPLARTEAIKGPDGSQPVSVGDILGAIGFASAERLATLVAGWHSLIELTAPDLVITDYAPTANLALYGGPIPWVPIGDGFTLPPFETPEFLPFREARPAFPEPQMLEVVATVQAARGRPTPQRLPLLFEGARRYVVTIPELDPWRRARSQSPVGPISPPPLPVSRPPKESYFAYLSAAFGPTEKLLAGLAASGRSGSIFLRDSTAGQREAWRQRGLRVWEEPQNLPAMAEKAGVIVHHAGVGTSEQVLGLGRPQLLMPRHFEQYANASALGRLGVAAGMRGGGNFTDDDVSRALVMTTENPKIAERAQACARQLASRSNDALDIVATACLDLVAQRPDRSSRVGQA